MESAWGQELSLIGKFLVFLLCGCKIQERAECIEEPVGPWLAECGHTKEHNQSGNNY